MSSLVDKLTKQAIETSEERGPEWLDKALAKGRELIATTGGTTELDAVRTMGDLALGNLEKNKAHLVGLGYQRTLAFLNRVAIGQNDQAAAILTAYGGGRGAWGAADAAVVSSGDKTEQAKRDQDEAVALTKEIGSAVAKAALPILLAAVAV